jgi:integrase
VPAQPVDATPPGVNLSPKGGVHETRETMEAVFDPAGRYVETKTGVPVFTILPDSVVRALDVIPRVTPVRFFWSGTCDLDGVVSSWRKRLSKLFQLANVSDGHAHRFRDTFATELLLAGVPIERVSRLLGHQSVRITEKHYAPWTESRQRQIEAGRFTAGLGARPHRASSKEAYTTVTRRKCRVN